MNPPLFPFTALVGLEVLKTALQLAAIDVRLSLLVRGDKGSGKSTASRALAALLADGAPFVNLPIGATEDRLLGGLDLERALRNEPALKPGLLAQADGGVLYIDEVNLLPDHLADAILDAVASGVHIVEREGFSARQDARFVLVGSMNPEEGSLRPQLLDRFSLAVDVGAPMDPATRREAVSRRLAFDTDSAAFAADWMPAEEKLAQRVRLARERLDAIVCDADILDLISQTVCDRGVRSLRADLAIVRASRALAALEGERAVSAAHVETVLPLALLHRARGSKQMSPLRPPESAPSDLPTPNEGGDASQPERVFAARALSAPRLILSDKASPAAGRQAGHGDAGVGVVTGTRASADPGELDVRATVVAASVRSRVRNDPAPDWTTALELRREDLHGKVREPVAGIRFVFVVDSSGSHAVEQRMQFVKGAVNGLLQTSMTRRDEVVVVSVRGAAAEVVVKPTHRCDEASAALAYLPTGGRTPLAHGLELAAGYITGTAVLVLITDGRANVPSRSGDAWADALKSAAAIGCPSVVIDSEGAQATGRARALADVMGATHVRLADLDQSTIIHVLRQRASLA